MEGRNVGKDVGAVIQAVAILRALSDAKTPLGVTALAREAGVSPSTTLNILRTLTGQGLVAFSSHDKGYALDVGLLELARKLLNRSHVDLLLPRLQDLANRFEASATVWQSLGDKHLLVGRVVPETGMHIEFAIASRVPAYAGAAGRMVIAVSGMDKKQIRAAQAGLKWNTPVPFEKYLKEIEAARRDGYAIDVGAYLRSLTSVASLILDVNGKPNLAISMHTFLGQLSGEKLVELGVELKAVCLRMQAALHGRFA